MAKTPAQRIKKHGAKAVVPQHELPPVINPSTSRTPQKAQSNSNLILIAGVVASLFLFWYLHLLTLNQLTQLSGGLAMPDSLVGGFDQGFVEQLRTAMDQDARGQLNYIHKTAGTLFPLIFGFSWLLLIGTNVARKPLRWALWAIPLLFAAVRLWGNAAIDSMMSAETVDAGQVALASGLTVAGWVLLVLSLAGRRRRGVSGPEGCPARGPDHGTCPALVRGHWTYSHYVQSWRAERRACPLRLQASVLGGRNPRARSARCCAPARSKCSAAFSRCSPAAHAHPEPYTPCPAGGRLPRGLRREVVLVAAQTFQQFDCRRGSPAR